MTLDCASFSYEARISINYANTAMTMSSWGVGPADDTQSAQRPLDMVLHSEGFCCPYRQAESKDGTIFLTKGNADKCVLNSALLRHPNYVCDTWATWKAHASNGTHTSNCFTSLKLQESFVLFRFGHVWKTDAFSLLDAASDLRFLALLSVSIECLLAAAVSLNFLPFPLQHTPSFSFSQTPILPTAMQMNLKGVLLIRFTLVLIRPAVWFHNALGLWASTVLWLYFV